MWLRPMVTTLNNYFEESKNFFETGEIKKSLETYEKAIAYLDKKSKSSSLQFLNQILTYCRENKLKEEEAVVLRALGRTYSLFKQYVESLRFHEESLRIQRELGKKIDIAEGLLFLAEDLEISGDYEKCLKTFADSEKIFRELGVLEQAQKIQIEVARLKEFSKEVVEDEYIMNKFHVDNY